MSSWTYPIPCSAFLSWELIIRLPTAYFFAAVHGNQRQQSSLAIIAYHFIAGGLIFSNSCPSSLMIYFFGQLSAENDNYERNILLFTSLFLHWLTFLIIDPLKATNEPNFRCIPKSMTLTLSFLFYLFIFRYFILFSLALLSKTIIFRKSVLCDALPSMRKISSVPVLDDWILDKHKCYVGMFMGVYRLVKGNGLYYGNCCVRFCIFKLNWDFGEHFCIVKGTMDGI